MVHDPQFGTGRQYKLKTLLVGGGGKNFLEMLRWGMAKKKIGNHSFRWIMIFKCKLINGDCLIMCLTCFNVGWTAVENICNIN